MSTTDKRFDLVLHIRISGIHVDDLADTISDPELGYVDDLHGLILDELLESRVGISVLPVPHGDDVLELQTYTAEIVDAELVDATVRRGAAS